MSANVETMMYVRNKPWHGIGTEVLDAPTSADALRLAGLDWEVCQRDVFSQMIVKNGDEESTIMQKVAGYKENYRNTDGKSLGIVGRRYKICQNADAFDFTDSLAGGGEIHYETAGSLKEGKQIWLLAKLEGNRKILGDEFENYLVFTNSHDGTGSIKAAVTPVRVVCNNTLNLALRQAKRVWKTTHTGDVSGKLKEAEMVLFHANNYLDELSTVAERMANTPLPQEDLEEMLKGLFPIETDMGKNAEENVKRMRSQYMACYFMPDIKEFRGTQWGAINAMSDLIGHHNPRRNAKNYVANRWGKIMVGHQLMDNMVAMMVDKR